MTLILCCVLQVETWIRFNMLLKYFSLVGEMEQINLAAFIKPTFLFHITSVLVLLILCVGKVK
jgi:hypothetical protein